MISAGYGSLALLLENPERVAAAAAVGAMLKDGLTMDGTVLENLERAVHLVRDGARPFHLGLLARVASLVLKDGTLEDTGGVERVERDPSPRVPSRKDRSPRDPRPREAREDGTTAAILAGVLESLASLVDPLVIGQPTQVIGLTMVGAIPESRVRVAAVEVETRGLTLHTTHGMAQESQVRAAVEVETRGPTVTHGATVATQAQGRVERDQAEVETHGRTVALMTGPTVATQGQERVAKDQAEVETHGRTVALMTGPTVATQSQERVARGQAGLLVSPGSLARHHLVKDGLLAVMIGRLLPTALQESLGRQVLVPTAMKPAIQQQRPYHLTRNIQIAERLDGY